MIKTYGEKLPGKQPKEGDEMITFFNILRKEYPEVAKLATHVRNEGNRTHSQTNRQKAEGMNKGFSDVIIAGCPTFLCEMKSKSKTSRISKEQVEFLEAADEAGCFACIAYGYEAALEALKDWMNAQR
jgi:hypothetical protein